MKWMFILLLSLFMVMPIQSKAQCLQADIMIIMDWSGSERGNECTLATAATMFAAELPVEETQIHMGLITFNSTIEDVVPLGSDKMLLLTNIAVIALTNANSGTYIEDAIMTAGQMLNNGRNVPKVIVIISDGEIYDMNSGLLQLTALKHALPIGIFAVQIGGDSTGFQNLVLLTGNANSVEQTIPSELLTALKKLNICG